MRKITLGLLLFVSFVAAGCGQQTSDLDSDLTMDQKTVLAQCLTDKGVTMYGTERCPHCNNQKAAFGDAFAQVTFVDCDKQSVQCQLAGIEGYPTWIFADGSQLVGEQELQALAAQATCQL